MGGIFFQFPFFALIKLTNKTVFVILLLLNTCVSTLSTNNDHSDQMIHIDTFLHTQFERAKVEIAKSVMGLNYRIQNNRYKREHSLLVNVSWSKTMDDIERPLGTKVFSEFNETFLIIGKTIKVVNKSDNYLDEDLTNSLASFAADDHIIFSKVFEWRFVRFLLFGIKSGKTLVYTSSSVIGRNKLKLSQVISHHSSKESYPIDVEFFVHDENLYLFLIYDTLNHGKVTSVLYRWENTYFDFEVKGVLTEGAVGVSSLNYGSSVVIVVIQSENEEDETKKVSSLVLKFLRKGKENVKLEKLHFLPTIKPQCIINFESFDTNFIFVCEKGSSSTIYCWEGGEFIKWLDVPEIHDCKNVFTALIADNRLFFIQGNNDICIYLMTWKDLVKVNVIPFAGEIIAFSVKESRLIAALKSEKSVKIIVMNIIVENSLEVGVDPVQQHDPVWNCFDELTNELGKTKEKLLNINHNFSEFRLQGRSAFVRVKTQGLNNNLTIFEGYVNDTKNYNFIKKYSFTGLINHELDNLYNKSTTLLINFKQNNKHKKNNPWFNFKGDLYIDSLKINSALARLINNYVIEGSQLISLSRDQYLNNVEAKSVSANWLLVDEFKRKPYNDLVLKNTKNVEWDQNVTISNLACCNIIFSHTILINGINLNDIVLWNNTMYSINDVKRFQKIKAKTVTIEHINGVSFDKWFELSLIPALANLNNSELNLNDNAVVDSLNVQFISGINMDLFLNNLFINGIDNIINGMVYFTQGFEVKQLYAPVIIDLKRNTTIEFPYGRENSRVKHADNTNRKFPKQQVYKKKLFVQGNMQVNEIVFDNCVLVIGSAKVPITSLASKYWTHNTDQTVLDRVRFNKQVRIEGDLSSVNKINGINIDDLFFTDHIKDINSSLSFIEAEINGNITTENNKYFNITKLQDLVNQHSIDEFILNFSDNLLQGNSTKEKLRNSNYVISNKPSKNQEISLSKQKITVDGNLVVGGNIETDQINKVNISNIHEEFYSDDGKEENFVFSDIRAKTINVKKLNGILFEEIIHVKQQEAHKKIVDRLKLTNDIFVAGMDVKTVNNLSVRKILPKVVNGSQNSKIKGKKIFKSKLIVVNNLSIDSMNGVKIQDMANGYFSRSKPQVITGEYYLTNISMDSLKVNFINGVDTSSFVNMKSDKDILIKSDEIVFEKLYVDGDIITHNLLDGCYLPNDESPLSFDFFKTNWSVLDVKGDVYWDTQDNNKRRLQTLFDDAVTLDGVQKITGSVTFLQNVFTDNIYTNKTIKNINISHIMSDAVLQNKKDQVISGEKIFVKYVNSLNATVSDEVLAEIINGINITLINQNAVRKNVDQFVTGHKHFENGFTASNFKTGGTINGVLTADIVMADTEKQLPHITFKNLEVIRNFHFETINNIRLRKFLSQRVLISGRQNMIESDLIFNGKVSLTGESFIQSLNNIIINDVVLKNKRPSNKTIAVNGCKTFLKPLSVQGILHVDLINSKNISKIYESCVLSNENSTITGNLIFKGNVTLQNTLQASSFKVGETKIGFLNEADENAKDFINSLHRRDDHN